ncbi:unnamed protein product [Rotaria sp. Silwood2]|nr:unnamed protein product [Rotaria sp. Silwood2]CAF3990272.1 unnamed protein product [Rotaria sp. Silwood2]
MARNTDEDNHEQKLRNIVHCNHQIRNIVQVNVHKFLSLREELLTNTGIRDLTAFKDVLSPLIDGPRIEQLKSCIMSDKAHIALCGENSSGKTAFLHAFLGIGKILPSGDGPVTARITKLTYASSEQACIRIRKTLRDQSLAENEVDLSTFFASEKPHWTNVGRALSKHVKRPQGIDETSHEFAEWAQCVVEIHIPSPTLALGIDVYDTPGFLLDDAPVLKQILHDLVELIHPTIVFMYSNPSTDDATKGCFLAMKTALYDLDSTSIFFLNSKADLNQMPKFKQGMAIDEFLTTLADQRAQRYNLLLRAPFLANDRLDGLPASIGECHCFGICSVNSQLIKPYGPLMNETTIQHIIQFVGNNNLAVATRVCKVVLPIINAFFNLLLLTRYRTPERLVQLHYDAMNWERDYFQAYTIYTEKGLEDLFSNIFQQFNTEEDFIVQEVLKTHAPPNLFELAILTAVHLQVIKPAIRDTLRQFMGYVFAHIASHCDLTRGAAFNEILIGALGRQDISDFAASLLDNHPIQKTIRASTLYMMNTISTPFLKCAQHLLNLDFSHETISMTLSKNIKEFHENQNCDTKRELNDIVRKYLLNVQKVIKNQQNTMWQAVRLWGDQQDAILRSLIDIHYEKACPLIDSHQETLNRLQQYVWRFIVTECGLCAAQDMAKFNGSIPEIRNGDSKSTMFSIFTADWGDEKNLVVKKLSRSLPDQPIAAYYEAHYHRKVANLCHPNMVNIRYLYEYRLDNQTSELWMIFPPLMLTLEQFLQQFLASLSITTVLKWMNDIVDALMALHQNELVHRNVVMSNIVLTEDKRALLIDLGDWYEDCDLSVRHDPSSTFNGTNDDIKGFGTLGQILSSFIEQDENVLAIINEFNELMLTCSQATHEKPVTTEFVQQKIQFMLDM